MSIQAKTFDNGTRNSESTVTELNRVVAQAEELLKTLGEEGPPVVNVGSRTWNAPLSCTPSGARPRPVRCEWNARRFPSITASAGPLTPSVVFGTVSVGAAPTAAV